METLTLWNINDNYVRDCSYDRRVEHGKHVASNSYDNEGGDDDDDDGDSSTQQSWLQHIIIC